MGSNERMPEYERRRQENIKRNDEMLGGAQNPFKAQGPLRRRCRRCGQTPEMDSSCYDEFIRLMDVENERWYKKSQYAGCESRKISHQLRHRTPKF